MSPIASDLVSQSHLVDAVYFDTEPLRAAGWPHLSDALLNFVALARLVKVPLYLPAAVRRELAEQYVRDFDELHFKYKQKMADHLGRVGLSLPDPPTEEALAKAFAERSDAATSGLRLLDVPLTTRPLAEVHEAFVKRTSPFDREGRGFGDAVIFESVAEHFAASNAKFGLIVTNDKDFGGIDRVARARGLNLAAADLTTAEKKLSDRLNAVARLRFDTQSARLNTFLANHEVELRDFLVRNVEFSSAHFGLFSNIESVDAIKSIGFTKLDTTPPLWDERLVPGTVVELKLHLTLGLEVTGKVATFLWSAPTTKIFGVGRTTIESTANERGPQEPRDRKTEVSREVEVEASVVATDNGYDNLVLKSVRNVDSFTLGRLGGD
jgi:hypothetical protein